jgi:putative nucleotidyltransferase with HDIG domain
MDETHLRRARELLDEYIPADNLKKHCLATEAIMRALAPRYGADADLWGTAGLLHDLDYDETKDDMGRHGEVTATILRREGYPEEMIEAIRSHNADNLGIERTKPFGIALAAAESATGLIAAMALILPSKKVADVKTKSVVKRMKETAFARNVDREDIRRAGEIGLEVRDFLDVGVKAMQGVAADLDL